MRASLLAIVCVLAACSHLGKSGVWTALIEGERGLHNFIVLGDARWRGENGAVVGGGGTWHSFLVSRRIYADFQIRAEFWAEHTTNSGIHIRVQDPGNVTPKNSYEVNIFDSAPAPEFSTGSIVGFAKVDPIHKAAGRWNTCLITARADSITVELNGVRTVELRDAMFVRGHIALQWGVLPKDVPGGPIRWRRLEVREL